ncbi:hypothetical protein BU26DRAFT_608075, partial [Trematosphaeria pertusa]
RYSPPPSPPPSPHHGPRRIRSGPDKSGCASYRHICRNIPVSPSHASSPDYWRPVVHQAPPLLLGEVARAHHSPTQSNTPRALSSSAHLILPRDAVFWLQLALLASAETPLGHLWRERPKDTRERHPLRKLLPLRSEKLHLRYEPAGIPHRRPWLRSHSAVCPRAGNKQVR